VRKSRSLSAAVRFVAPWLLRIKSSFCGSSRRSPSFNFQIASARTRGLAKFPASPWLLALSLMALCASPAQAQFATGGTGLYKDSIFWVSWGTPGDNVFAGKTVTRGFNVGSPATPANRMDITCTLSNAVATAGTQYLGIYTPGNYQGDGLDELYNIGGNQPGQGANPNTLRVGLATAGSSTVEFDLSCSATLGGAPFPLRGLVFADAEATAPNEYIGARLTNGGSLRVIDQISQCGQIGQVVRSGNEVQFTGPTTICHQDANPARRAGPALVGYVDGATKARVLARGGGVSAVAVGAMLDLEFSEAIPISYGVAAHILSPVWTGGVATSGVNYHVAANQAKRDFGIRLGATIQPSQNAGGPVGNATVDALPKATGPLGAGYAAVATPNGIPGSTYQIANVACRGPAVVAGWIDFNGNGVFDPGERSGSVACPAGSNKVTLTWTLPADYKAQRTSYMRLRIASDAADLAQATGVAKDGEAEDYLLEVSGAPQVTAAKQLTDESVAKDGIADPGEVLTYTITLKNSGTGAATNFNFIENIPDGATMISVTGANGFTDPVKGPATVQLTVPQIPVDATETVTVQFAVAAPIPLGVTQIRNLISGGDLPPDCTECSVTTPTPPPSSTGVPTMSCSTDGAYFNTAYNGAGGKLASGTDPYWAIAMTTTPVTGAPPAGLSYTAATVVSNPAPNWMTSPFGNANWIAHNATGAHSVKVDAFYRYQFNLDPAVDPASLDLKMNFYADNAVYEVWVNGVAQGIRSNFGGADPYFYGGFVPGGGATASMGSNWRSGLNTIIVHTKSAPAAQGFMAQINPNQICQPKITLRKAVVNDKGGLLTPDDFTLRASGPNVIEGVMGEAQITNASVPAGTYALGEDAVTGYVGSQYSCAVDGGAAVTGDTLTLANGQNAICTITNSNQPARLTLRKSVVNDLGGSAQASDFTLSATGPTTISGETGASSVTNAEVSAGTYALSETNLPGYAAGDYSCSLNGGAPVAGNSLVLAGGDEAVCTVVNDDIAAQLTLVKTVSNSHGGTATPANFTLTATGPVTISGVTGDAAVTDAAVPAGSYVLRETNIPGYSGGDYSCAVNGGAAVAGNTLTLANGDAAVCTIANQDQPATLTLVKTLDNSHGGIAAATDFTLSATGPVAISGATGSAQVTAVTVPAGVYALSEANLPGYAAGSYSCAINGAAPALGNSVTLVSGDAAVCTIVNSDIAPAVTIRKELIDESIAHDEVPQPDEVLTYRITLTNTGGTASNYSLTDKLDGNVDFLAASNGGTLSGQEIVWSGLTVPASNGATAGELVLTVEVQVKNPLPAGETTVTNMAKKTGDPDPSCPSDQCVQIPAPAKITLKKELIGESMVEDRSPQPGEVLTYQITLTNTGGAAINYSVTDKLDANVSFVSADNSGVAGGEGVVWNGLAVPAQAGATPGTLVLTVQVQVDDPLAPGAIVTNLVKETGDTDPACPSDQCVQIPDPAHVSISKTLVGESGALPGIAEPGETLTYKITLSNTGGATNDYNVTDKLDANTTFISADHGGVHAGGTVEWTNLTVPAYTGGAPGVLELLVEVSVNTPLPAGTTKVSNIAFEAGQTEPSCPSAQCVELPTPAVIAIDKKLVGESGSKAGVAEPGETLTYQITLTNTGGAATGYAVTDRLDPNVSFVSASDDGISSGSDVSWTNLAVPAQLGAVPGSRVLTVRTKVASPLPAGVTSIANVAFEIGQPEPSCPSAQCVELPTPPNVTVKKQLAGESGAQAGIAEPGETLTYQITLTNTGGPATDFAVVDKLDPNVSFATADHGGAAISGNVEWSGLAIPQQTGATPGVLVLTVVTRVNDPIPAGITRIGNVAYEKGEPEPSCPSDQCVSLPTPPVITIEKKLTGESGSRAGIAEPGETLTYTITLTNVGGPATNYAVTDVLDSNVTFANASDGGTLSGSNVNWTGLAVPGQVGAVPGTRTLVVRTKVKDPLPPGATNVSNIAVKTGDPLPSCPSAQCVEVPTPAAVTVDKQLTGESRTVDGIAEPGEVLTYTITLTNTGGTDFANFKLTEHVPAGATLTAVGGATGFAGPVSGTGTLDLTVPVVPANSATTVTVLFEIADPLPAGVTSVVNAVSGGDVPPDCSTCAVTTPTPAKVTLDKRLTGESLVADGIAQPGEVLTYTLTLTNSGGSPFANFKLTEHVPAGATLTAVSGAGGFTAPVTGPGSADLTVASVPAKGTATVTVTFKVDDPLADGVTSIVNTVSGGDVDPDCTTCSVTTPTAPKVTVDKKLTGESKTVDGIAQPGEVLTYTLTLTNGGGSPFSNFRFTENVPAGAKLTAVSGASGFGSAVAGPGTANLTVATVPANGTATVTVQFTVDDPLADGVASIVNTVSGGDVDPGCTTCSVTVPTAPKVTVTKALTDESITVNQIAEPGEVLTYTVTLTNAGGSDFADFDFTENVPAGVTLTAVTGASGFTSPVAGPGTLDLTVASVPANGAATVTVEFTVDDPLPAGLADVVNTVSGGNIDPACTICSVTTPLAKPELAVVKTGKFEDTDASGGPTPGDTLVYSFVVTNTGNLPLDNVSPVDAGPTFNGHAASNSLSAMTPASLTLAPGESQTFTATYPLSQADIDSAAGIVDGINNTAKAQGYRGGVMVPSNLVESNDSVALIALPAVAASDITVSKQASLRYIRIGEKAPYTITVTNNAAAKVSGITVTDVTPSGFRYVDGSATIDGVAVTPVVNGRNIVFDNLSVPGNGKLVIRLQLTALSSAGPGKHVNTAIATDKDGNRLAPDAKATVEIIAEPVFDCGDIIGKVFDDKNGNGYQDEGEPGLPGVRLATVNGVLMTTDAHGRFHIACADLPDKRIGSNFILKLDTRTLPSGYSLTTENPRVVRLTAGKMTKLNFGAWIGRVVRLDLKDEAFVAGRIELKPEWSKGLDQLVDLLGKEKSVLRVSYAGDAKELAGERMRALEKEIAERWRQAGHRTSLDIETRVEASK